MKEPLTFLICGKDSIDFPNEMTVNRFSELHQNLYLRVEN